MHSAQHFSPIRKLYGNNIYKLNLVTEQEHMIQHQHFVRSMGAYYHLQMKVFYPNGNDLPRVGMFRNSDGIRKLGWNRYSRLLYVLYGHRLLFVFLCSFSSMLSRMHNWGLSLYLIEIETANTLKISKQVKRQKFKYQIKFRISTTDIIRILPAYMPNTIHKHILFWKSWFWG